MRGRTGPFLTGAESPGRYPRLPESVEGAILNKFEYTGPALTVDCVVFDGDRVVLIRRRNEPFRGQYALPGGFVDKGETVEAACARELLEETGLTATRLRLVGVYSDPGRDPRGHTVTVAFLGEADVTKARAGDDAAAVELVADWRSRPIAFDHRQIIADAWRLLVSSK